MAVERAGDCRLLTLPWPEVHSVYRFLFPKLGPGRSLLYCTWGTGPGCWIYLPCSTPTEVLGTRSVYVPSITTQEPDAKKKTVADMHVPAVIHASLLPGTCIHLLVRCPSPYRREMPTMHKAR